MIHDCSFVLCWLFMSPLFVLNSWTEHCSSDKSSTFCRFCSFPAFLHIWTLSSSDCMILRSIFSHWGQLRDSNTTIKKGSNIHWCSRRTHDALRAGGWKLFEFEDQGKLYLTCLPGNMQVSSVASEGSNKWKNIYISTKEKSWKSSSCSKVFNTSS